jgi:PPOX class probable F420-dependent enzyme
MSTTPEAERDFMRTHHRAVLATLRGDGRPQLSPILVGIDDDGAMIVSTRESAIKTLNIRRTAWASVCAFEDGFFGDWLQAEGTANVESLPAAMDGLVRYYRLVAGEHPDWDEYRAAMQREGRVLLRIQLERVGPSRSG